MTIEEWLISKKTIEKSRKQYAHFDYRTDISKVKDYICNPTNIAKHSFYPFIHYTKEMIKFSKSAGKKKKTRDICYAAHIDRCIFQLYSFKLSELYNARIQQLGISSVPIAYRTDLHKNNIHFAKQAFDFIRDTSSSYIMIGDFTSFFDRLDHSYLKQQWCSLCEVDKLPADHYAVFKNITRYSTWELTDLLEINGLQNMSAGISELNKRSLVITKKQYKENKSQIKKNPNTYGIPQGSPISALLANVYMLDIDKAIFDIVAESNGLYMRYSDDFIIVLPKANDNSAQEKLTSIIRIINQTPGLTLEPKKTQFFRSAEQAIANCGSEFNDSADCSNRFINFLGFTFDGKKVIIRPKTTSKYYYRMYRKAKTIAANGGYSRKGKHISGKNLYERYSIRGAFGEKGNYLTYVNRAQTIFGPKEAIDRDTKRHMQKIRNALKSKK